MAVERPEGPRETPQLGPLGEEPKKKETGWKVPWAKGAGEAEPLKGSGRKVSWWPKWATQFLETVRGPQENQSQQFQHLKGLITTKEAKVLSKENQFEVLEFVRTCLESGPLDKGIESFPPEQRNLALSLLSAYEKGEPFSMTQDQLQKLLTAVFNFYLQNQQKEIGHAFYALVQKLYTDGVVDENTAKNLIDVYQSKSSFQPQEILTTLQALDRLTSQYTEVEAFTRSSAPNFHVADLGLSPNAALNLDVPKVLHLEENETNGPYIQKVGEKLKEILLKTFEETLTLAGAEGKEVVFSRESLQKMPPKEIVELLRTHTRPKGEPVLETPLPVIIRCWAETEIETIDHLKVYPSHLVGRISQLFIPGQFEKQLENALGQLRSRMDHLRLAPTKREGAMTGLQELSVSLMDALMKGSEETKPLP